MRVEFDGTNGAEIIAALQEARSKNTDRAERGEKLEANPDYTGNALSIDIVYPDNQRRLDTWRVPVDYFIEINTGEVTNADGEPQDWDDLVSMS